MIRPAHLTKTALIKLFTGLRLLLTRHEERSSVFFWAALIGFSGALTSVAFREGIRLIELTITGRSGSLVHVASVLPWWQRILIPVVGGLLAGWILHFGARALQARRAVDYMEAVVVGSGVIGARSTILRSVSSLFSIASGGSIGREGPMVQLAALIGSKLGQATDAPVPRLRLMVACGASAGIAAAYNAPIAGALFVAEIVMGSIAMENFGPLLVSSVTASVTIHHFLGYAAVFQVPSFQFVSNWELVFYALLGVVLGQLSPPFLALLQWSKQQFAKLTLPPYLTLPLGGLLVGIISVFVPQVWGNGYSVVNEILHGDLAGWLLLIILGAKVLSTAATVGSGAVGGVFTPTLFMGAAVGASIGGVLHLALPGIVSAAASYALVGMGGFLAATTHAPLMSILMIFELTLNYQVLLPLILACVSAHYAAKVYRRGESIYHASLVADTRERAKNDPGWQLETVGALIKPASAVVRRGTSLQSVLNGLPKRPAPVVYVVNDNYELVASADTRRLLDDVKEGHIAPTATIDTVAMPVIMNLRSNMELGAALDVFLRADALTLPVTEGQWKSTLVGQISRQDLLLALQDRLARDARDASRN